MKKASNGRDVEPVTIEVLQETLENETLFSQTTGLSIVSADEFYCADASFGMLNNYEQYAYVWAKKVFEDNVVVDDWFLSYRQVYTTNLVLEKLLDIPVVAANEEIYRHTMGSAFFLRAYAFYNVAQVFALPFDPITAAYIPGIPIRLSSDVSEPSKRSTMLKTYQQIIADLKTSVDWLPVLRESARPNHPSRLAAFGMLARVYLSMREYALAGKYADSCLQLYDSLIDYNLIDPANPNPFSRTNAEVLYQSRMFSSYNFTIGIRTGGCFIDSNLYKSYETGDLRPGLFFQQTPDGKPIWKSGYYGGDFPFSGLALDEIYLIRAECLAREGYVAQAMEMANKLLEKRWKAGQFTPFNAASPKEALSFVLRERNKELVLRGARWTDLRRLNLQDTAITLKRYLKGQLYTLPPNNNRYALPIPEPAIRLSGMQQNPR